MKANAKHQMATPIQVPTIMSWLMYWPPTRNARLVPSMITTRRARASVLRVRVARYSSTSISPTCSAGTKRSDRACTPKVASDAASSQCSSGGL